MLGESSAAPLWTGVLARPGEGSEVGRGRRQTWSHGRAPQTLAHAPRRPLLGPCVPLPPGPAPVGRAPGQVRARGPRPPCSRGGFSPPFLRPVLARPTSPSRTKAGPARSRPRSCLISSGASPPHPLQAGGVEPGQPALRCATRLSEVKQDSVQPPPWNGPHGHTWGENAIIHVLSCLLGPKAAQRGAAGVAQHAEHVPHPPAPRSLLV